MKTKTQLLAERNVLKQLLSTALGAVGDPELTSAAAAFADGICRHFALLFAAGCSVPRTATWQQPIPQDKAVGNSPPANASRATASSPVDGRPASTPGEYFPCTSNDSLSVCLAEVLWPGADPEPLSRQAGGSHNKAHAVHACRVDWQQSCAAKGLYGRQR